jgi:DNA invertase Pin-like site-specific DNA recombinase
MNEKITAHHLERGAIAYVRQSSPIQVRRNHESRRLQYAMKGKLVELGWPASHVEVIDDDLGITANGTRHRSGFEQLVNKVATGQVGIVAAREVSRLARNSSDWQRLLEQCRLSDTMILDHETLYNTRLPNDSLLLGIKSNIM